jgi:DNA-binding HxlR family transcriptional regulator
VTSYAAVLDVTYEEEATLADRHCPASQRYLGGVDDRAPAAPDQTSCPGSGLFELLGRRWSAYLVWALLDGPRRFTELLGVSGGVSDRMLAKRLRELEHAGIVSRRRFREAPPRVEYSLTEAGYALRPVIQAMEEWGRRWQHAAGSIRTSRGG